MLKGRYLFLILVLCIFIISSVNAEEMDISSTNDTSQLPIDVCEVNEESQILQDYDNNISLGNEHDELSNVSSLDLESESAEDILKDSSKGTFSELHNMFPVSDYEIISLKKDYYLNDNFYSTSASGKALNVYYSMTLNGNGHIIDGLSISNFDVRPSNRGNVTFNDIIFKNFVTYRAEWTVGIIGAIDIRSDNYSFVNCTFINIKAATGRDCAILSWGAKSSSFINCTFINCSSINNGGAICFIEGSNSSIAGCTFVNCSSSRLGGALWFEDLNSSSIVNCSFSDCSSFNSAGAIGLLNVNNSSIVNSTFDKNRAKGNGTGRIVDIAVNDEESQQLDVGSHGGAIDLWFVNNFLLDYCSFNSNVASGGAGAIGIFITSGNVTDCEFSNNSAFYAGTIMCEVSNITFNNITISNSSSFNFGGAIASLDSNIILDTCNFYDYSSLRAAGGAIYTSGGSSRIINSSFVNGRYSLYGGAIANSQSNLTILSSRFINNSGENGGVIYCVQGDVYVNDTLFNNSRSSQGSVIFCSLSHSLIFTNNVFINSTGIQYVIYSVYSHDGIVESGNRFEGTYQNKTFFEYNDLIGFNGHEIAVSLINSSQSTSNVIPSYYNSCDYGYITPVRNQGDSGNCWAFAAIATLEACIKKATGLTYDLSENNPKNIMALDSELGSNLETNCGGYDSVVIGYLNSWLGPISEITDIYDAYSSLSPIYPSIFHIQNIYFLPVRDNDLFKRTIMDYGAVAVSLKWSNGDNHAVSLVGWIDDYNDFDSWGNYAEHAWIFKNSWGPDWDDHGFGYLSFDVEFLSDDSYSPYHAYTFVFDKSEDYFKSYQYDYSGTNDYLASEGYIYYSNKFVCDEDSNHDEVLAAFATYFRNPTNYTVSLYVNGELRLSQSGYSEAGYYTIPFNEEIDLVKGDEFTIMIANRNNGMNYVPVCRFDQTTIANVNPGISAVSFDGENWFDLYDLEGPNDYLFEANFQSNTCQVACIKAFTRDSSPYEISLEVNRFTTLKLNETVIINMRLSGNHSIESTNNTLIALSINGKEYYVKINDGKASLNLSFDKFDTYTLSAQYKNNIFKSNLVKFTFTVSKEKTSLSAKSLTKVYGGSEKSIITLKDSKGNILKNAVINVYLNGKSANYKTNSKGQICVPVTLVPNSYIATVKYAGNSKYMGATAKVKIVVRKATPKITAKAKTFKKSVRTKQYSMILKNNLGKVMKNTMVSIKVNKVTYYTKTNSKGVATFKITKLTKLGKHKAIITYAGSAYYNKVARNVIIAVI